jgi:uncharacterized protein
VIAPGDPAHDLEHTLRVVSSAKSLCAAEGGDPAIVVPAAWLHDCVAVPKGSPDRPRASWLSAEAAAALLARLGYPAEAIPAIHHAIHAHSFSAGVEPLTIEARVVQDADRLDALGAIGLARTLMLGGTMGIPLYHGGEPIPNHRPPDERAFVLDHLFTKLLTLAGTMRTPGGRREAERRTEFLREYVRQLQSELDPA